MWHNAAAASWSVFSCCSGARVAVRSSLLTLLKATAMPGSSTLHSCTKRMPCSSPLSADSAIATRARGAPRREGICQRMAVSSGVALPQGQQK